MGVPSKVLYKIGRLEVLEPSFNPQTIADGRGAIRSWIPSEDIKEFTLLDFYPGKVRGNHYHPEFIEYFLVLKGKLVLSTLDMENQNLISKIIESGFCFRTPLGVVHAVESLESSTCISLITKPWDDCQFPIVRKSIVEFNSDYIRYINEID